MPAKDKTIDQLTKLAHSVVDEFGLVLVGVSILTQGKRRVLNVTIHRKGSRVSLDDCEAVSRRLDAILDEMVANDPEPGISGPYVLQVESPGIDRTLKNETEYKIFEGETVELNLKESVEGLPLSLKGVLMGLHESCVRIKNPSSIEKPKSAKSKSQKQSQKQKASAACLDIKKEIDIPLTSLYSVKLFPEITDYDGVQAEGEDGADLLESDDQETTI